jgi:hypothetical protein
MAITHAAAHGPGHLRSGIQSTVLSSAAAGLGSLIRIPLTIAAVGVSGYGALSPICALFGWVFFIAAGARNAGGAVAVSLAHSEDEPTSVARIVARETLRHAAPVVGLLAVLVVVLPWHTLVDPDHTMSHTVLEVVLFASLIIGLAAVPGAALLGVYTTRGRFRDQNVAIVAGISLTTGLVAVAYGVGAGAGWFTVIWVASLAVPALPVLLTFRRAPGRRGYSGQRATSEIGSISGSSLWIAAGQQFASGFDLVIISVILGSEEAAAYGLVSRLAQLALTPLIGAVPVLTQSAGRARSARLPRGRRAARSLTLAVAGMQCAGLLVFVVLGGWASRLLSGGHIAPSTSLLVATAGWGVIETARRCLMSASATAHGLRHWRRSNLAFAVPNLALSVILTKYVGVSGPMLASLVAVGAMVAVSAWSLRGDLKEVLGR